MAPKIRNLAGYTNGIAGRALLSRLRRQAEKFLVEITPGEATVRKRNGAFEVSFAQETVRTKYVILAVGSRDRQPKNCNFIKLCRAGLLAYCPICDGYEHSKQKIGVLIDQANAIKKARFFNNFSANIHLFHVGPISPSSKQLTDIRQRGINISAGQLEKIDRHRSGNKISVKLLGQPPVTVDVTYIELGMRVSNRPTRHLKGLKKTKDGRFLMNRHQQTSIHNLYAVGDCANSLAQVSVAIGEAAVAATNIINKINHAREFPTYKGRPHEKQKQTRQTHPRQRGLTPAHGHATA